MTMFGYNRDELTSTLPDGGSISFTDGFPDGTLVEPGVYFTNDTDSGLVRNGPIGGPSIIGVVLDGVTSTVFTADVGAASSTSAGSTTCMVLASSGNNNVTAIGHSTVTASTSVAIGDSASAGSLGVSIGANTQTGSRSLALGVSSNCAGTDTL